DNPIDGFIDRHTVILGTVTIPERHGIGFGVFASGNQHKGCLVFGSGANFLREPVGGVIDPSSYSMTFKRVNDIVQVVVEGVVYWNSDDLLRCQPRWKSTRIMFGQYPHESLNRPK